MKNVVWLAAIVNNDGIHGPYVADYFDEKREADAWAAVQLCQIAESHAVIREVGKWFASGILFGLSVVNEHNNDERRAEILQELGNEKLIYITRELDRRGIRWGTCDPEAYDIPEPYVISVPACKFGHGNAYDYGEHGPEKYECTVDDPFLQEIFHDPMIYVESCGECCGCGSW